MSSSLLYSFYVLQLLLCIWKELNIRHYCFLVLSCSPTFANQLLFPFPFFLTQLYVVLFVLFSRTLGEHFWWVISCLSFISIFPHIYVFWSQKVAIKAHVVTVKIAVNTAVMIDSTAVVIIVLSRMGNCT
jgi:hypothetical protein